MAPDTKSRAKYWARRLECPVDDNANYRNTFWCNRDLIPIPEDRRTWTWQGFAGYWVICGYVPVSFSIAQGLFLLIQKTIVGTRRWRDLSGLTAPQHQHDGMDCWLDLAFAGAECTAGHGRHGWRCFDIGTHRGSRRLAGQPSLSWLHGHVSGLLGHARRLLAGVEPHHDGLRLDGHPNVLGRAV